MTDRTFQTRQATFPAEQLDGLIDRRRKRTTGNGNAQGLTDFTHADIQLHSDGFDHRVNSGCRPVIERSKTLAQKLQRLQCRRFEYLGGRLGIVFGKILEKIQNTVDQLIDRLHALTIQINH